MKPDPMSAPEVIPGTRAVAQPVAAPLTRAAIFLVATVNPGFGNRAVLQSFCGDLAALVRAVEFRDLEGGLSCVVGFGADCPFRFGGGRNREPDLPRDGLRQLGRQGEEFVSFAIVTLRPNVSVAGGMDHDQDTFGRR